MTSSIFLPTKSTYRFLFHWSVSPEIARTSAGCMRSLISRYSVFGDVLCICPSSRAERASREASNKIPWAFLLFLPPLDAASTLSVFHASQFVRRTDSAGLRVYCLVRHQYSQVSVLDVMLVVCTRYHKLL